jgi:hypothetical protein
MPKLKNLFLPLSALIFAISLSLILPQSSFAQEQAPQVFISEEVGAWGETPAQKRSGQQQAFDLADDLDSTWLQNLEDIKEEGTAVSTQTATITPQSPNTFQFLNLNSQPVTVTADNVDIKNPTNPADLGTKSSNSYQYQAKLDLPGSGANTYNGNTMQDFAPIPRKFEGQHYANESQNGFGDQNNFRNGLLFTFSEPLQAFGVWLGDLETRTDGHGAAAILRLFNSSDELISESVIPPNNWITEGDQNQSICGTANTTTDLINKMGCGHNTTRFVGFTSSSDSILSLVKKMLIIVGDDDNFPDQPEDNNGNTEHISFIAPTAAFFQAKIPEPEPPAEPEEPELPTEPQQPEPNTPEPQNPQQPTSQTEPESPQIASALAFTTSTSTVSSNQTQQNLSLTKSTKPELASTGQSPVLLLSLTLILVVTAATTKKFFPQKDYWE